MPNRRWMMWQGLVTPSLERFILTPLERGCELSGLILQAHEEGPYVARYRIQVDQSWTTQTVEIELENGGRRTLSLTRNPGGRWSKGGEPEPQFDGCADIDLEWSPSTNTLPIRRLGLDPGTTATVTAVWIRFPSLDIQPLEQSYEKLSDRRYRYRSGEFTADLDVDDDGIVTRYGVNWKVVASSGEIEPLSIFGNND